MRSGILIVLVVAAALAAPACVVNEPESPPRGLVVSGPPPAPVREERPSPSDPRAAWIQGYWHWTGMQYAWIPGHWEAPPPGHTWSAPVYTTREGRYFYESGSWKAAEPAPSKNAIR